MAEIPSSLPSLSRIVRPLLGTLEVSIPDRPSSGSSRRIRCPTHTYSVENTVKIVVIMPRRERKRIVADDRWCRQENYRKTADVPLPLRFPVIIQSPCAKLLHYFLEGCLAVKKLSIIICWFMPESRVGFPLNRIGGIGVTNGYIVEFMYSVSIICHPSLFII
jgi:hypothetical protein